MTEVIARLDEVTYRDAPPSCHPGAGAALAALARVAQATTALPLFSAAAAAAAAALRRRHTDAVLSNFAESSSAAAAANVADVAALGAYASAAALAASLALTGAVPKLASRCVAVLASAILLLLQTGDDVALPKTPGASASTLAALRDDLRDAAPFLAPFSWLALAALAQGPAPVDAAAVLLALAGPAAVARAATRRTAVDAALVAWPLTLAPFALTNADLDGKLLGALGCAASTIIALLYDDPKTDYVD